ncbi:Fic family protein [Desulfonauticus submarinus]
MDFVKKHLPDPFYQEEDKRISLRNKIFRETVVNILIHREFINPYPAKMIIEENFVLFENASKPHGFGKLTPESFSPFPKNPNIAKIFREIGLAEEMGSGVRNLFKYSKIYSGFEPEIEEGDIFKVVIRVPIKKENIPQVPPQDTPQAEELSKREIAILDFCKIPRSADEIGKFINIKDRKHLRNSILKPLLEKKLLKLTIPDKPNSPKQKYLYEGKAFITPHTSPQVSPQATPQATPQDTPQAEKLSEREMAILDFCKIPRSADEIGKFINIKDRKHLRNSILKPLLEKKLLKLTIPDKPTSSKQKYLSALKEIKNNE